MTFTRKEKNYLQVRDRFEFLVRSEHTPTGIENVNVSELIDRGKIDLLKEKFKNYDYKSVISDSNYKDFKSFILNGNLGVL